MTVAEVYHCARALEAIENYARADVLALPEPPPARKNLNDIDLFDDGSFWSIVLEKPEKQWGRIFVLERFVLSEWIPRVPGLFWAPGSKTLRDLAKDAVEYKSKNWVTFKPIGKSQIVLGGIGTLKLPPNEQGYRLVCLSAGLNASSGIPALIASEVWESCHLREGDLLVVEAVWRQMSLGWAEQFESIQGIPRGYLVISSPQQIHILDHKFPIQFHPFTVMEYSAGEARLFDFVYAIADTRVAGYRKKLEHFFERYKQKNERYGRYLLSANVNEPLWDALYDSPAAVRRAVSGAEAQLDILKMRVREQSFRGKNLDAIIQLLSANFNNTALRRYSDQLQIPTSLWFTGASPADSAVQLLNICLERGKVELLLDAIGRDNPTLFLPGGG